MGCGWLCGVLLPLLAAGTAVYIAFLPCAVDPVQWVDAPPLRVLDGPLTPNELLISATHLHAENASIVAPEAFVFTEEGNMFAGLADGTVALMNSRGENAMLVFHTGTFVAYKGEELKRDTGVDISSKNGVDKQSPLLEKCMKMAAEGTLHHDKEQEMKCGRTLGLRRTQDDGTLYIIDAYHGLFSWKKWQAVHLFDAMKQQPQAVKGAPPETVSPPTSTIGPDFGWMATEPAKFMNDLAIVPSGNIYITDTSWKHVRQQNRLEIIDAAPRGRLLRYNPKDGSMTTVLCGLHFPNGVELDQSGENLLVVESMRFRILEIPLSVLESDAAVAKLDGIGACYNGGVTGGGGGGGGKVRVWSSNLPGFVDNMRYDFQTRTYLAPCGTKASAPFSLMYAAITLPPILRILALKLLSVKTIEKFVPKYGLVLSIDKHGTIVQSYHDPTGRTPMISSAQRNPKSKFLFLGSHSNPFLGRLFLP